MDKTSGDTTLILIPGLLCDATVWRSQCAALADLADVRVAEHGMHDSLPAIARSILASAPPRFAVAGHSMGGRIALEIYRAAPDRVTGIALMDTGFQPFPGGEAGKHEAAGRQRLLDIARREGMRAMAQEWVQGMVHPARRGDRLLIDGILDMLESKTPELYAAQIRALLARPDAGPVFATIRCPALVLCGREDSWSPVARHREIAAAIPGSTFVGIPDCGHMCTLERPEAVNDAMRRWLQTVLEAEGERSSGRKRRPALQRVALIGFGEAGSVLGADLVRAGCTVSAYDILLDQPQARAAMRARMEREKVRAADTLAAAVADAGLVISAVTAASSGDVALLAGASLRAGQIFLDINSVSPAKKQTSCRAVEASGADYVEAAVMAPVPPQRLKVPMLLGGRRAAAVAPLLCELGMNAKAIAAQIGVASAVKMCRSVIIKGIEALTVESMTAARRFGAEDQVLASLAHTFPRMGWEKDLPDYLISRVAEHGRRRAEEMREVARTLKDVGIQPTMAEAIAERQDELVDAMVTGGLEYDQNEPFSWRALVDALSGAAAAKTADLAASTTTNAPAAAKR